MTFASDKLYNGYLRSNLAKFVNTVRANEILPHLPCLTQSDRDEICAKKESRGNYDAILLLLDCLKRREHWPEQLIQALKECEHLMLSKEIEMEYNSLKAPMNGRTAPAGGPALSPASSVEPHPPLASPSGGHPATPNAPAGGPPATAANLSLSPALAPPAPSSDAPKQRPPEHAGVEVPQAVAVADSPAPQNPQHDSSPVKESLISSHKASTDPVETQDLSTTSRQNLPATPVHPFCLEDHVSVHTDHSLASEALTASSAGPTPNKQQSTVNAPIQETTGTTSVNVSRDPVENSDPTAHQVKDSCQQVELCQGSAALHRTGITTPSSNGGQSSNLASSTFSDGATAGEEYFSKPGVLQSSAENVRKAPNFSVRSPSQCASEAPYSGDRDRLEISESQVHTCRPEPEEDHYESFHSSQMVYTNEIRISEEPPVQNNAGQSLSSPREIPMSMPVHKGHHVEGSPYRDSSFHHLLENYYIPATVVVAACMVGLLWRLKK